MSLSLRPFERLASAAALVTLLLGSPALGAEETFPRPPAENAAAPRPSARGTASLSIDLLVAGMSLGGPSGSIESAMRVAGLDDPGHGGILGTEHVSYPRTHDLPERATVWIAGRGRLRGGVWRFGFGAGGTGLGTVEGHASPADLYVTAKSTVFSVVPMAWLQAAPALRLGFGPALHVVDVDTDIGDFPGADPPEEFANRRWRLGLLVEAALQYPVDRPYYFLLLGQYRWVAETTVDIPAPGGSLSVGVPLSHVFVGAGVGIRF
ncbi:MAG: hypothetical protein IPP07_12145 [Holophagales bacterium]|nr:hypothetical protein [Holophagales bacterium]